jgi:hypothetical protein
VSSVGAGSLALLFPYDLVRSPLRLFGALLPVPISVISFLFAREQSPALQAVLTPSFLLDQRICAPVSVYAHRFFCLPDFLRRRWVNFLPRPSAAPDCLARVCLQAVSSVEVLLFKCQSVLGLGC